MRRTILPSLVCLILLATSPVFASISDDIEPIGGATNDNPDPFSTAVINDNPDPFSAVGDGPDPFGHVTMWWICSISDDSDPFSSAAVCVGIISEDPEPLGAVVAP